MKYILLIYSNEKDWTEGERAECMSESAALCHELAAKGQYIDASPLQSVTAATSLRIRDGKRVITDGPFAETAEQIAGFAVIEVDDLDAALEWAAGHPDAEWASVEIRPLVPWPPPPGVAG